MALRDEFEGDIIEDRPYWNCAHHDDDETEEIGYGDGDATNPFPLGWRSMEPCPCGEYARLTPKSDRRESRFRKLYDAATTASEREMLLTILASERLPEDDYLWYFLALSRIPDHFDREQLKQQTSEALQNFSRALEDFNEDAIGERITREVVAEVQRGVHETIVPRLSWHQRHFRFKWAATGALLTLVITLGSMTMGYLVGTSDVFKHYDKLYAERLAGFLTSRTPLTRRSAERSWTSSSAIPPRR